MALTLPAGSPALAEVVDKVAIVVNNEIITYGEIDRMLSPAYEKYKTLYQGDELAKKLEEARQNIIAQLIEDRLILGEAKKKNVEVDDREVDSKIAETEKRFASKEGFDQALAAQHVTLKELRTRYKEQIMTRRMIDQKVGGTIMVSPSEINKYYEEHVNEFREPEEIKLRMILVRPKEGLEGLKALDLVNEIKRRLREGGDFAALARTYSEGPNAEDGGLMGYVKREDLHPEIDKAIAVLKDQETSDVVQTSLGWQFFRVEEKKHPKTIPLSEARQMIEEKLFADKAKDKIKGWVDNLRKNAYIAFK